MENSSSNRQKTVLIIDDEPVICEMLSRYIGSLGYITHSANNCSELLLFLDKEIPDIIFLDIILPEIDGIKILKLLRRVDPDIQIVMISGISSDEIAISALKLGAFDYISKPLDLNRISDVLRGIEFTS